MARGNTQIIEFRRGLALNVGGTTRVTEGWPLGEGWYKLMLVFNHVVTIGTGAGALAQGGLRAIRGITLKTDKGETPLNNVPARPLYFFDEAKSGTPADLDAIVAGNGTYRAFLPIWFFDPKMRRPMDLIFDTRRYKSITLEINYGGVADLYSTVGTSSVAPTVDIYIERQRGPLPDRIRPVYLIEYGIRPPVDPNTTTEITLERAANLAYKRLLLFNSSAGALVASIPFSGNADSALVSEYRIEHDGGNQWDTTLERVVRSQNKQDYMLETARAGATIADFVRDGSLQSSLYSGDKSRLRYLLTLASGAASPGQSSVAYEGWRPLIP